MGELRKLIVVISVIAVMAYTVMAYACTAVFAEDDGFSYQWDGYTCTVTMPSELTEGAVLYWPDGSMTEDELTGGETIELDMEDYVKGEFDAGNNPCAVLVEYCAEDDDPVFSVYNSFYTETVELRAGRAMTADTEFKLAVDSVRLYDWEADAYENLSAEDTENYIQWVENSVTIPKGEIAATGRVVYNWQNSVDRGPEAMFDDGAGHIVVLKLADNPVINDGGLWGIFSCIDPIEPTDFLFSLGYWNNDPDKLTTELSPLIQDFLTSNDISGEDNLETYLSGITKADRIIFTDRVKTGDMMDQFDLGLHR